MGQIEDGHLEAEPWSEAGCVTVVKTDDYGDATIRPDGSFRTKRPQPTSVPSPKDSEELRHRFQIMADMWHLVKLELPTHSELEDLTPQCWVDHVDYILSDQVARAKVKASDGRVIFAPTWVAVLEHELEIRKKATELANTKGKKLAEALALAWDDDTIHRQYFVLPTSLSAGVEAAVAASFSSGSFPAPRQGSGLGLSQASFLEQIEKAVHDVDNRAVQQALGKAGREAGAGPRGAGRGRARGRARGRGRAWCWSRW